MADETTPDAPADNEIVQAAAASKNSEKESRKRITTGVAVGVGSAAIVAALLYVNRSRKNDKAE